MVGDDVEEDLDAAGVGGVDERLELGVRAEVRVDLGEVGDPVAVVAGRGVRAGALDRPVLEDRRHPDRGGAEPLDVVEPVEQAREVAAVVEALVGRVEAGGQPVAGQAAVVVGRVAVVEAVGQDEVEDLVGQVVAQASAGRAPRPPGSGGVVALTSTVTAFVDAVYVNVTVSPRRDGERARRRPG